MLRAPAIVVLLLANLLLWGTPILVVGLVKFVLWGPPKGRVIRTLAWFGEHWVTCNDWIFGTLLDTRWTVEGLEGLSRDGHYLVVSNHVSWVDIFAVFRAFRGRAPFIRFFLKRVLIWFPIVGQACAALEFPFMRRYTPEYLAKHPEKRGRDFQTTYRACRRYRHIPVTILNFLEGTRFSEEKREDQGSPYEHLLRPRIGGISFVLASMAGLLDAMYDVTIVYPPGEVTMWRFVTNRIPWIHVHARRLEIPPGFHDVAVTEPGPERDRFKSWVEALWAEKDAVITRHRSGPRVYESFR